MPGATRKPDVVLAADADRFASYKSWANGVIDLVVIGANVGVLRPAIVAYNASANPEGIIMARIVLCTVSIALCLLQAILLVALSVVHPQTPEPVGGRCSFVCCARSCACCNRNPYRVWKEAELISTEGYCCTSCWQGDIELDEEKERERVAWFSAQWDAFDSTWRGLFRAGYGWRSGNHMREQFLLFWPLQDKEGWHSFYSAVREKIKVQLAESGVAPQSAGFPETDAELTRWVERDFRIVNSKRKKSPPALAHRALPDRGPVPEGRAIAHVESRTDVPGGALSGSETGRGPLLARSGGNMNNFASDDDTGAGATDASVTSAVRPSARGVVAVGTASVDVSTHDDDVIRRGRPIAVPRRRHDGDAEERQPLLARPADEEAGVRPDGPGTNHGEGEPAIKTFNGTPTDIQTCVFIVAFVLLVVNTAIGYVAE